MVGRCSSRRVATGSPPGSPSRIRAPSSRRGEPGAHSLANGSSRIISDNGITAVTFNPGGGSHVTAGYGMRDLMVAAASGATTGHGIVVNNAEYFTATNVAVSKY